MAKLKMSPMWLVNEGKENEAVYHYSDRDRAIANESGEVKEIWAVMDANFFIGTWQFTKDMELFNTEQEAEKYLEGK